MTAVTADIFLEFPVVWSMLGICSHRVSPIFYSRKLPWVFFHIFVFLLLPIDLHVYYLLFSVVKKGFLLIIICFAHVFLSHGLITVTLFKVSFVTIITVGFLLHIFSFFIILLVIFLFHMLVSNTSFNIFIKYIHDNFPKFFSCVNFLHLHEEDTKFSYVLSFSCGLSSPRMVVKFVINCAKCKPSLQL